VKGRLVRDLAGALIVVTMAAGPAVAQRPDRSAPPAPGPAPSLRLPVIEQRSLSNGLPVWIIESHEVPLVQLNLVFRSGSGEDPAGRYGVASLTADMLDEGAGDRSALEIADAIDGLGAVLTTASTFDASAIRLNVPVARLDEALAVMADVALRPAFPAADLERVRKDRLTSLLQVRDEPASLASIALARAIYGPDHRYGTPAMGTRTSIEALTAADLRAFHATHYVPANATLLVVGDVRPDAILPRLEQRFGTWAGVAPERTPLGTTRADARRIVLIDAPGTSQSQIRIGAVGAARTTPDRAAIEVVNTLLGGTFTSRLNQNLRETHGYSYGAYSAFDLRRSPGPFMAAAGVQTDKTAAALTEFFREFTALAKPTPDAELKPARDYLALSYPAEFETLTDLSRRLEELAIYEQPVDTLEQYVERVQAVTPGTAARAAATYIRPSTFVIVIVGDRATIEPGLRALDLAPIATWEVGPLLEGA